MNITEIIAAAVKELPKGDHDAGLKAITRHINVAISHFERDGTGEGDGFTDAIYRCNQAFEGGLKEAYRVLTGDDPSKLTPYQIENYLEKHALIRPRALKQLTRYREDYRNPSAHDYKLDFDEDEALLAILSVCGFTKLLLNQISAKLLYQIGGGQKDMSLGGDYSTDHALCVAIARIITSALNSNLIRTSSGNVEHFVDGLLSASGLETDLRVEDEPSFDHDDPPWGNLVHSSKVAAPVEVRNFPHASLGISLNWILEKAVEENRKNVVLIIYSSASNNYNFIYREVQYRSDIIIHLVYDTGLGEVMSKGEDARVYNSLIEEG